MTDAVQLAKSEPAAPVVPAEPDGAPRSANIDILRGIAILAILFMNINGMGASLYAFFGDVRHYGWTGADQAAWWTREVLANGTARALLEMLFGAGMVILTDRAATRMGKWQVFGSYVWRNMVLFAFGLIHVFVLLWPGDILHTYGLAAIVAVLFRRFRPRWLIVFGLVFSVLTLGGTSIGVSIGQAQSRHVAELRVKRDAGQTLSAGEIKTLTAADVERAERAKSKAESAARVAAEDRARSGSAAQWVGAAWGAFHFIQSKILPGFLEFIFVWEAASTMLIGAALYKLGILQGARTRPFYVGLTVIAYVIGLPLRAWWAFELTRFDGTGPGLSQATNELARLTMTVGHVGLVNLILMSVGGTKLLRPFEAAGRTALSVYILQTVICVFVLYPPWGLGLYAQQGWASFMLTALTINAALLWLSNWWVKNFAIAPVEWAWRSIVERRQLPFRLQPKDTGSGTPVAVAA